jgi:hypothetical protein
MVCYMKQIKGIVRKWFMCRVDLGDAIKYMREARLREFFKF